MKRLSVRSMLMLILACLLLPGVIQAQSSNLLANPGFEPPFAAAGGTPVRQVAQGWSPWHIGGGQSASENIQPEYYAATDTTNGLGLPRIRSGSDAQQYFTFFATHDGGLFQRVTGVTQGAQFRFSAYVYVWSSTYEDMNKSEVPGGVVVQVGIDPTGGTNGESANIIWSQPAVQYDAYNPYTVTANAQGTAVTVFIRTTVTEPVKNTNIYVDDASLTLASVPTQPPTATKAATAVPTQSPPTATKTLVPTQAPTDLGIVTATLPGAATQAPTQPPTATLPPTIIPASPTPTQDIFIPPATPITPVPTATLVSGTPASNVFPGTVYHTVRSGDTVFDLSKLYGSQVDAIIQANGLNQNAFIQIGQVLAVPVTVPDPATATPTPTSAVVIVVTLPPVDPNQPGTATSYVVQPGDTLFRLAVRFNTTTTTLARLNGIANPNLIRIGQRLLIPTGAGPVVPTPTAPATYVVLPGDTLFRIALRFRVSIASLVQANGILDPNLIFVGQTLVIP